MYIYLNTSDGTNKELSLLSLLQHICTLKIKNLHYLITKILIYKKSKFPLKHLIENNLK